MNSLSEKYGAEQVAFVLAGLVALREDAENGFDVGPFYPQSGICWNIQSLHIRHSQLPDSLLALYDNNTIIARDELSEVWGELRDYLFAEWPGFSGNLSYPVPGTGVATRYEVDAYGDEYELSETEYDRLDAEDTFDSTLDMWEGEYGESRLRLLDYMIDRLAAEVREDGQE